MLRCRWRTNVQRRRKDILESNAGIVAAACPFCNTMLTDGIKNSNKEEDIKVMDIAELIAASI
jgi:heterodisulfide reductase subunit D